MSDILTRIMLPNSPAMCGLMVYGRESVEHMIARLRQNGKAMVEEGQMLLDAKDEDFQVDIVRGSIAAHHVKELQKSKLKKG
jgi:hypothetical protein